ncbi:hypothetical protein SNOG_14639 [Parastagonospora nodorum SN15]|uniref:Uncharacterized protein n=1 Tax=Phaeosphaeria nodorum (strain SN15 / ATCC MYA-4574 / FGSC 10173) TaxID=321614 RepID=Q0U0C3_PHANO|nr:hypothetical protein SNOG_14639 [Parastagonospora nodorum SN15]EAT77831.1 hypothetical protein SNOG_14639 [Parastagonospora nodorum SN15]
MWNISLATRCRTTEAVDFTRSYYSKCPGLQMTFLDGNMTII